MDFLSKEAHKFTSSGSRKTLQKKDIGKQELRTPLQTRQLFNSSYLKIKLSTKWTVLASWKELSTKPNLYFNLSNVYILPHSENEISR